MTPHDQHTTGASSQPARPYRAALLAALFLVTDAGCDRGDRTTLETIDVTPAEARVEVGSSVEFRATGRYSDGTDKDITASVAWSSSNPTLALVARDGVATAGRPGALLVTATLDGRSGVSNLQVPGITELDLVTIDAPAAAYLRQPVLRSNASGELLLLYGLDGPRKSLVAKAGGEAWPPTWTDVGPEIRDYWATSALDQGLALDAQGRGAVVYRVAADDLNSDPYGFGFAYFDGVAWSYTGTHEGFLGAQWSFASEGDQRTPVVALGADGIAYVAYQKVTDGWAADTVVIARFDASGPLDAIEFTEPVGNLYVASNPAGGVMVLNTASGSRVFDGARWGELSPFARVLESNARLILSDTGTADFVVISSQVIHYRYDGARWSDGETLNGPQSAVGSSVAVGADGRMLAAFIPAFEQSVQIRSFDGSTWGPPVQLAYADATNWRPRALVDGSGHFVVMWDARLYTWASYFDDRWHAPTSLGPSGVFEPTSAMSPDGHIVLISDRFFYNTLYAATFQLRP
jgi:hypothetical protein